MVKDIESYKQNIDLLFGNINNLSNTEKEVFIFTILEELCKKTDLNRKYCPICGNESAFFLPYGESPRKNALCPYCFSLERHRFFYLFFKKVINIDKNEAKCLAINLENKTINILDEIPKLNVYNLKANFNKDNFENPLNEYKLNSFDIIVTRDINRLYGEVNKLDSILKPSGLLVFAGESNYKFKLSINRLKKLEFIIRKYSLSDILENELIDKYSVVNMDMFVARKNYFAINKK